MATRDIMPKGADNQGPVLVAIDFAPDSQAAVNWASVYAACVHAPLLILHVVHDPAEAPGFYRQEGEDWTQPMEDVAKRMMTDFITSLKAAHSELDPLINAKTMLVSGLPPSRINEIAANEKARIIVLGSKGRTGLPHVLLGSVAERVAQTATVAVVIVKSDQKGDENE